MAGVPLQCRAGRVVTVIKTVIVLAECHQLVVLREDEELRATLAVTPIHTDFLVAFVVVQLL